jgi:hypothetical protein
VEEMLYRYPALNPASLRAAVRRISRSADEQVK